MPIKIDQAVILAGGYNSRMMPIAKIIPKVMLPLGHRPALYYIIKECFDSGIKRIFVVVRQHGSVIENYFKPDVPLRRALADRGRQDILNEMAEMEKWYGKMVFVEQANPHGEAHAIYKVKSRLNPTRRTAILFGDTVYQSKVPALKQIIRKPQKELLVFGIGRFIIAGKSLNLFTAETVEGIPNFDKRIVDLFATEQMAFYRIEGRKFSTGSIEEYHESVCLWPD